MIEQLILDIVARCVRITETTAAEVNCEYNGHCNFISVYGYGKGYDNAPKDKDEYSIPSFTPLGSIASRLYLDGDNAQEKLKNLLTKLDKFERSLMVNA